VQVWRGSAAVAAAIGILVMVWTFSWLWFGLYLCYGLEFLLGFWFFLLGALPLEKCAPTLVGYWSSTRIILFVKFKVIGGGLCAYVWVAILLYCLWKNEDIPLFITKVPWLSFHTQIIMNHIKFINHSFEPPPHARGINKRAWPEINDGDPK
jgi:hypothetical protein